MKYSSVPEGRNYSFVHHVLRMEASSAANVVQRRLAGNFDTVVADFKFLSQRR